MDCNLPTTGGVVAWSLIIFAVLLLFAGGALFILGRRRKRKAALWGIVPLVLAALLASNIPAPSAQAANDCPPAAASPVATSTPTSTPSPSASPSSTPTPTPGDDLTVDTDNDKLPDVVEDRFGSDPNKADTDGDGLTDAEEAAVTTDPTKPDTDGNGVTDPLDDLDGDGLTNRQELTFGTQPFNPDTDTDGLGDADEVGRGTDPLKADTDADGVSDGDEVKVGSNPLLADADQTFTYTIAPSDVPASLVAEGTPAALVATTVEEAPEPEFGGVSGLVGTPVIVNAADGISKGTLNLSFDPTTVPSGADLAVLHFNEDTGEYDQPADQSIDLATGTATVTTTTFSPFIIVDLNEFNEIWKHEIVVPREGSGTTKQWLNTVLAIDSSGSMYWNDPSDLRKDAAKIFVDSLLDGDKAAVVDFDDYARLLQPLTVDHAAVKVAIDQIDSDGGTDIGAAVRASLDELNTDADNSRARIIVLLTDGDGAYDNALTTEAANSKTTIYTVGLGSSTNQTLLDGIATATGGKFFLVQNADGLKDAYTRIGGDLGKPDSDGDGLSDEAETNGWHTQRGNVYKTDPNKADTDGDGLTDGEEAGNLISTKIGYAGISSALVKDTDGDGVEDGQEVFLGSSPLSRDSDGDGLSDNREYDFGSDPVEYNADGDIYNDLEERSKGTDPYTYDLGPDEAKAAVLGGAIFGDWHWGAEHVGGMNEYQIQSFQYIGGQLASGIAIIGDIRDVIANIGQGDVFAALLSGAAFIPAIGDGVGLAAKLVKFGKSGTKAEKAAFHYIDSLPIDKSAKKMLVGKVFGTGAKVFPKALEGGPVSTSVYFGVRDGKKVYVGITNNMAKRGAQHGTRFDLDEITTAPLSRGQARAIEQVLITRNPGFENKINSISASHPYYKEAFEWAEQWLLDHGL